MAQYISKSALVAEIDRRIKEIEEIGTYLSPKGVLTNLLCHLNTLEVKEVDLKKDFELTWEDVAWIVNKAILLCKVSTLTAEDICKDVLKQFKAKNYERNLLDHPCR